MSGSGGPGPVSPKRALRDVAVRCSVLAALVLAYRLCFIPLHALIGNPAFLAGLFLCVAAAVWLGLRGALVVIVVIALIDRSFALSVAAGPETGPTAGVIALLVKLLLAGGLGLVVDSRRRVSALNARLRHEIEARKQTDEALQHSERMYRTLVESLGEGVGLFDAKDRVVLANQAL